ncbi:MAG TPA: efflux RND transporter permease subunit, partial [Gammaproteobacteria bacterium]|nr:efflux RND transporter permease subunit [Gammaproteobacteria bacterium]
MLSALIERIVRFRGVIAALILACVGLSIYAVRTAPLDAIPDTSDPQVIIYAKWPRSPELLEAQVTEPVIRALIGSPDIRSIRATSHMGYSFIYVILRGAARRDAVRAAIADRLSAIRQQLPADAVVTVGPSASGIGWIYEYALIDHEQLRDPRELRLLNDNQIKPALQTVPGIAEVASVGGLEKQYQLKVYPPLLAEAGISVRQLVEALQGALEEAGGRVIEVTNRDYQIRGVVRHDSIDELEALVVGYRPDGRAVLLKDVGYIQVGYDQRRGIAELNGEGEVVGGIVIMEQTQNALEITHALKQRIAEIGASLPAGVEIVPTYDRSELIWGTLRHFLVTLVYELSVVIVVTVLFLRNLRTALAPVLILLLGVLFTAMPMAAFDQTINLFSLAGLFIAIGEMVDATIVIVENCTAELAAHPNASAEERRRIILSSIAGVARPLLFSLLIILASFLPVFFLSAKEARLFDPLAYSKTFAMAFSTLLTLFLLPIVMLWVFRGQAIKAHGGLQLGFIAFYRRAVHAVVRFRYAFLAI